MFSKKKKIITPIVYLFLNDYPHPGGIPRYLFNEHWPEVIFA